MQRSDHREKECQSRDILQKEHAWSAPHFNNTPFSAMKSSMMYSVHTLNFSKMLLALGLPAAKPHMHLAAHMLLREMTLCKRARLHRHQGVAHLTTRFIASFSINHLVFQGLQPSQLLLCLRRLLVLICQHTHVVIQIVLPAGALLVI